MAIDFYRSTDLGEIEFEEFVSFEEETQHLLSTYFSEENIPLGIKILVELDSFEKTILDKEKIKTVLESIATVDLSDYNNETIQFLNNLYEFFAEAVEQNKKICAVGD